MKSLKIILASVVCAGFVYAADEAPKVEVQPSKTSSFVQFDEKAAEFQAKRVKLMDEMMELKKEQKEFFVDYVKDMNETQKKEFFAHLKDMKKDHMSQMREKTGCKGDFRGEHGKKIHDCKMKHAPKCERMKEEAPKCDMMEKKEPRQCDKMEKRAPKCGMMKKEEFKQCGEIKQKASKCEMMQKEAAPLIQNSEVDQVVVEHAQH